MNDIILKELSKDKFCDLVDIIQQLKQIPKCKNIKEKLTRKGVDKNMKHYLDYKNY